MYRFLFFIVFVFLSSLLHADVPAEQRPEVEHLLQFIHSSDCIFERNGTRYPAAEALLHIEKKYEYFRDRISSTEEFIEYSATKSTMSGSLYMVYCPGQDSMTSRAWLLAELQHYRSRQLHSEQ